MGLVNLVINLGINGVEKILSSLNDIKKGSKDTAKSADEMSDAFSSRVTSAMNLAETATNALAEVIARTGALVIQTGIDASNAARGYEDLHTRLEAITQSASRTSQILDFVNHLAGPSPFTMMQYANAATLLEAMGVNAMRALPLIGKLGAAFGADNEKLQLFTRAVGEMASGHPIEIRVMSQMGISKTDFANQGIQIDPNGQMTGSVTQQLEALERIVNTRFGDILQRTQGTLTARMATLSDAWTKTLITMGETINKYVGPTVDYISRLLTAISQTNVLSDAMARFDQGLSRLFSMGTGANDMVLTITSGLLSLIGNLPTFTAVIASNIEKIFTTVLHNIETAGKFAYESIEALSKMMNHEVKWPERQKFDDSGTWAAGVHNLQESMRYNQQWFEAFGKMLTPNSGVKFPDVPKFEGFHDLEKIPNPFAQTDEYLKKLSAFSGGNGDVPEAQGSFLTRDNPGQNTLGLLSRIADNTGKTYDVLSLRRQTTGGGELGALGVTPAELYGGRPAARLPFGRYVSGNLSTYFREIGDVMDGIVDRAIQDAIANASGGVGRFRPR